MPKKYNISQYKACCKTIVDSNKTYSCLECHCSKIKVAHCNTETHLYVRLCSIILFILTLFFTSLFLAKFLNINDFWQGIVCLISLYVSFIVLQFVDKNFPVYTLGQKSKL